MKRQRRLLALAAATLAELFTTLWIPGVSVKALRLGWWRFQRCPVGKQWTVVKPVKATDLTDKEERLARRRHDIRLP